jgi:hypothetical protein
LFSKKCVTRWGGHDEAGQAAAAAEGAKDWDPSPPDSLSKVVAKQQQRLKELKASKRRQRLK